MASYKQHVDAVLTSDQNDTATLNSAAESLAAGVHNAKDKDAVQCELEGLWVNVVKAARDASDANALDRLIHLLKNLKSLGSLSDEKYQTVLGTVWTDLPTLGMEMREEWNSSPEDTTSEQWANLNAFAAKISSAGLADFSLYGIWCFRELLEEKRPQPKQGPTSRYNPLMIENVEVDYDLPAALAWLEHAGADMVRWVQEQRDFGSGQENQPNPSKLGPLAKDADIQRLGYSAQRWQFWMQRLREIADLKDDAGGREKIAKLAYSALHKMENLSKELSL